MKFVLLGLMALPVYLFAQPKCEILYANHTFWLSSPPPLIEASGFDGKIKPYWKYHWEFGDNHYHASETGNGVKVKHQYRKAQKYLVRVFLTPHYSSSRDTSFSRWIDVPMGSNPPTPTSVSITGPEILMIKSNSDGELLPNAKVRMVIHYRIPANLSKSSGGKLYIGFNDPRENKKAGLHSAPYRFKPESVEGVSLRKLVDTDTWKYRDMLGYGETIGFECANLVPGEERRLFFTLEASKNLGQIIARLKSEKKVQTNIRVLWIPDGLPLQDQRTKGIFPLDIVPVHDPNKIIVRPRVAFFNPKDQTDPIYKVKFENIAEGIVREMVVSIPWDKTLNVDSLRLKKVSPDVTICYPGHNHANSPFPCMDIDTSDARHGGQLHFNFHKIYLVGTKTEDFKNSMAQGFIEFTAQRNNRWRDRTTLSAVIGFEHESPIRTNTAKTWWKQRAFGLKIGHHLAFPDSTNFINTAKFPNTLYPGVWYQHTPLNTGIGFGLEAQAMPFYLEDYNIYYFRTDTFSYIAARKDVLDMKNLEVNAILKYQIGSVLSIGVHGGVNFPLFAQGKNYSFRFPENNAPIVRDNRDNIDVLETYRLFSIYKKDFPDKTTTQRFGWFQKATDEEGFVPMRSQRTLGISAGFSAEAGLGSALMVGYRQNYRFLPKSYLMQNMSLSNSEVYVKIRLFNLR